MTTSWPRRRRPRTSTYRPRYAAAGRQRSLSFGSSSEPPACRPPASASVARQSEPGEQPTPRPHRSVLCQPCAYSIDAAGRNPSLTTVPDKFAGQRPGGRLELPGPPRRLHAAHLGLVLGRQQAEPVERASPLHGSRGHGVKKARRAGSRGRAGRGRGRGRLR